jgi:predicted dinucleotide-binding enzyme
MEEAQKVLPELKGLRCASLDSAVAEIDAVVVVTPWKHFHDLPALLRNRNPAVVFVDARRAFDPRSFASYEGIGM